MKTVFSATIALMMAGTLPAMAMDAKIYPYHAKHNYCPAGYQPVQISGVICCGKPNQSVSYQSVMAHPVAVKRHKPRRAHVAYDCPIGVKGCR
ncbi:hypothetical protein [Thalassococcus sp. S3]|uniref:hypothetical protein n=1 Tax=Thalassococcus sp. S3 TaxID=2017482 RepID=UPI0010244052|nr:hypothetical protein [Thalassococcus sp. S3]QBF32799.1 hypothetical protein CFI11_16475 [Thalassococcus sp. S3]